MDSEKSSTLLARWRAGDARAADILFQRYAERLIVLARSRLPERLSRRIDTEDVVQSAYRSFFANARDGRYQVQRGGDLWNLLVTITLHKLYHQVERWTSRKRNVEREQSAGGADGLGDWQSRLASEDPSPLEAVALIDLVEQLMQRLDPWERPVLESRLQGHDLNDIAAQARCSQRTVRRTLDKVKRQLEHWQEQGQGQ
jgi:RNA polymerase sigma-70 factor (ECF subfamily)